MLTVIWIMFAMASTNWVTDFSLLVVKIRSPTTTTAKHFETASNIVNSVCRINVSSLALYRLKAKLTIIQYALADAVLLWRVWVICKWEYTKLLVGAMIALGFSTGIKRLTILSTHSLQPTASISVYYLYHRSEISDNLWVT